MAQITQGFGAVFNFSTIGLNALNKAKASIIGLEKGLDKSLSVMRSKLLGFAGMTIVGAGGMILGKKITKSLHNMGMESADLETSITMLEGKFQKLNKVSFNNIIGDLRKIGITSEYTEKQVIDTADRLRGLGATAKNIRELTRASLGLAMGTGESPVMAGTVIKEAMNVFDMQADQIGSISDILLSAKNITALGGRLGLDEFSHLFKNVASFNDSINMKANEMLGVSAVFRGLGNSARLSGTKLKTLGKAFAGLEFKKVPKMMLSYAGIDIREKTGERKGFVKIVEELSKAYENMIATKGKKFADAFLESTLGTEASLAFRPLNTKIKKEGMLGWRSYLEGFSAEANKGQADKIVQMRLGTMTGQVSVFKGIISSIRTTIGMGIKNIEFKPLQRINQILSKIAYKLQDPKNKRILDLFVKIGFFGGIVLHLAGTVMLLAGGIGLLNVAMVTFGTSSSKMFLGGLVAIRTGLLFLLPIISIAIGLTVFVIAIKNFTKLTPKIQSLTIALGGLSVALIFMSFGLMKLSLIIAGIFIVAGITYYILKKWKDLNPLLKVGIMLVVTALSALAVGVGIVKVGSLALNAVWLANPMTWVILGIVGSVALLAFTFYGLYKQWDTIIDKLVLKLNKLKLAFLTTKLGLTYSFSADKDKERMIRDIAAVSKDIQFQEKNLMIEREMKVFHEHNHTIDARGMTETEKRLFIANQKYNDEQEERRIREGN